MKVGVYCTVEGMAWADLVAFWQFLDRETRFHSIWTPDHLVPVLPGLGPEAPSFDAWTTPAALAQATERVRLGCAVSGVTLRHPAIVAKMAATIDHISNGRLDLGLGAAWHGWEHHAFGIPFPSPREREDMLEEAVQVVRLLLGSRGPVDFEGRHYQLRQAVLSPRCVQDPHPPIVIGGSGERRTLRIVARYADVSNVIGGAALAQRKFAVLDRYCAAIGRDPGQITRSVVAPLVITNDSAETQRALEVMTPFAGGDSAEHLAIGSVEHVRRVLDAYAAASVELLLLVGLPPFPRAVYERISDEIIPAVT